MNTEFLFLRQLDDDLREAAAREMSAAEDLTVQVTEPTSGARAGGGAVTDLSSRRFARRLPHLRGSIAAGVSLLIVAGGIGFYVRSNGVVPREAADRPGSVVGISSPTAAPVPTQPGLGQFGSPGTKSAVGTNSRRQDQAVADAGGAAEAPAAPPAPRTGAGNRQDALGAVAIQGDLSKIVRDGSIGLEVGNGTFGRAVARLTGIAVANHGMVLSSSTKNESSGVFTLRIPAARFDQAMLQLRGIARLAHGQVLSDTRTGQDVTARFIDLRARLALLKQRRALLVSLQDKATTVGGILAIANKVDQVQLQIEQIQGQLNVLDNQVAESTIEASIREKDATDRAATPPSDSRLRSSWRLATDGFLNVVGAVVIGLGYLIPIAILVLAGFAVLTLVRRRRRATN
jgi:Domain of unknown function (DUF4349)